MREVPSELQGDLLEAMRDILKNLNDALEGPEVEYLIEIRFIKFRLGSINLG